MSLLDRMLQKDSDNSQQTHKRKRRRAKMVGRGAFSVDIDDITNDEELSESRESLKKFVGKKSA